MARASPTRHPVASIVLKPRGYRACLGIRVELTCGHQIVVPAGGERAGKRHDCYHCEEREAAGQTIAAAIRSWRE